MMDLCDCIQDANPPYWSDIDKVKLTKELDELYNDKDRVNDIRRLIEENPPDIINQIKEIVKLK